MDLIDSLKEMPEKVPSEDMMTVAVIMEIFQ